MASSSKSNNVHHIRSISLPSRSHPTTIQIEAELNKLKTWEPSSKSTDEKIHNGLIGLERCFTFVDELLDSPQTQQALSHHRCEKWVNELSDQLMRLLDFCGSTKDVVSQVKKQVRDLQSALRRRKGDSTSESSIAKYTSCRRRTKKDAKRLTAALKQIDNLVATTPLLDLDHQLLTVIRVLREVSAVSISVLKSLLLFLCAPISKTKPVRWSISKLILKGATTEDQSQISIELGAIDCHIEGNENGLESIFRNLVKTRASFLNILSH